MSKTDLKDTLANLTPFNDVDQLVFDAAVKRIEELEAEVERLEAVLPIGYGGLLELVEKHRSRANRAEAERDFIATVQEELYDTLTEAGADKANDISERLALLIHDRDRLRDALREILELVESFDNAANLSGPEIVRIATDALSTDEPQD